MSLRDKARPKGAAGRIARSLAGDSPSAREKVLKLVDELGFGAVLLC